MIDEGGCYYLIRSVWKKLKQIILFDFYEDEDKNEIDTSIAAILSKGDWP